jgi:hypothetical protein
MKNEILPLFASIEENRQFTGYYKKLQIPAIERGRESVKYTAGDAVSSTDLSPRRFAGATVESHDEQNGFIYYTVKLGKEKMRCRTKDLRAA